MRTRLWLLALMLCLPGCTTAAAQPCAAANAGCTEFVTISGGPWRALVYRNYPLTQRNEAVTQALVIIHGAERDAGMTFDTGIAAANAAGRAATGVVIAPRFAASVGMNCTDPLADHELNWNCDADLGDWRSGMPSFSTPAIFSFDVVDQILMVLARKEAFPNLRSIVVAGHGAGGQFVADYQLTNGVHAKLGVPVRYVTANALAYAYPDDDRPGALDREACPSYADWPFGMADRNGYVGRMSDAEIRAQAPQRPATYLVGEQDTQRVRGFYGSCKAFVQGASRLDRGVAFGRHMAERYGPGYRAIVVPACGNDEKCMLTAPASLPALFP